MAELERFIPARAVWAVSTLGLTVVLVLAAWLEPDPRGLGTHTQLGLPPCGFLWLTGLPCPGCGLTTSFALMAAGEWLRAFRTQPLGVLLYALCVFAWPVCAAGWIRGWSVHATLSRLPVYTVALGLSLLALFNWCVRLVSMWLA